MLLTDHADGKPRCWWPGYDPLYVAYHDTDWGVPERDDRALFEKLILDGFQAGLSWITILRKREHFRKVFDGFRPDVVSGYGPEKVAALLEDPGIIRNRAKIVGTVKAAGIYCDMMGRGEGFSDYLWKFVDGRPLQPDFRDRSQVPTETEVAQKLSKDLKARGFSFVGPTIVYAFMQAVGMTNDHMVGCFRHEEMKALG
ncbi:DNA-3-methyladenine glycosylase I [Phreatobacter cathodiphilus]|uniref:DNA-3-methyladenine glycosylase I n=1 Tax=Phreatobacter cathodiphilus TaxID=1868589 RepID=A0A2S0N750_9HYPH|nr:DNA-3-methyladenine glycosylase I [Phreatobacter cathodiphilus]AVO43955.1 DNA-3-methyladenine glycosylase I [Phreatobacter cathodiphilus]